MYLGMYVLVTAGIYGLTRKAEGAGWLVLLPALAILVPLWVGWFFIMTPLAYVAVWSRSS